MKNLPNIDCKFVIDIGSAEMEISYFKDNYGRRNGLSFIFRTKISII